MPIIKIVLVEDHELVREGFEHLILSGAGFDVVYSTGSAEKFIASLDDLRFDLLISDIALPGVDGIALAKEVKKLQPDAKIILLSMYESIYYVDRAKNAGVDGYIPKRQAANLLLQAINAVMRGEVFFDNALEGNSSHSKEAYKKYEALTQREKEIFINLAKGIPIKKIAASFNIAPKTVHAHKAKLFEKLEIYDDFSTTRLALKLGLIDAIDL